MRNMSFCITHFLNSGAIMSLSKDKLLIGWGTPSHVSAIEIDRSKPAFYFSDFFLTDSRPWIQYSNWMEIDKQEFEDLLQPAIELDACEWTIHQPEKFREAFEELGRLLQAGLLEKGVPYLFMHSSCPMDATRLQFCLQKGLASLRERAGYLYGYWHLSNGILGITPELLFSNTQHQPQKVHTMALAGTCPSSQSEQSFLNNPKERHEHQLVVQGISEALQPLGVVKIGEVQLLKLPKLMHLMTPIEIDLKGSFNFDALVKCLHPTPALGAFPSRAGKEWLHNFQQHTPRQYFGAPIGFQCSHTGNAQCFVGIRNVQWDSVRMRIGAGCGVVRQSLFDKEWQEIQLKIKTIRDQFHL
jgi:menaquinone-specific isochorismate synthase